MNRWYSLEGRKIWVTGGAGYLGSAITTDLDRVCGQVLCFDLPGKAEALVGLGQSIFIFASAAYILFAATTRLMQPTPVENSFEGVVGMIGENCVIHGRLLGWGIFGRRHAAFQPWPLSRNREAGRSAVPSELK